MPVVLKRGTLIGVIVAILGMAAIPTVGYSAAAGAGTKKETRAQKLAKELKACKKAKPERKRKRCEKRVLDRPGRAPRRTPEQEETRRRESREVREREAAAAPVPTTTAPTIIPPPVEEAPSATLIIHVFTFGGGRLTPEEVARYPNGGRPDEGQPLRISKLGPNGEVLSSIASSSHRVT